jgi:hypothetical protein
MVVNATCGARYLTILRYTNYLSICPGARPLHLLRLEGSQSDRLPEVAPLDDGLLGDAFADENSQMIVSHVLAYPILAYKIIFDRARLPSCDRN